MPVILCFGDSNAWGNIPGSFNPQLGLSGRYERSKRWTGILQKELGSDCHVVEEAINGRTTDLDEIAPGRPYKNGAALLPPCLEAHYPIDIVIFMLGTNDTKVQYRRSAREISEGMRRLVKMVKASNKGREGNAPKVLLIAPQPILRIPNLPAVLDDSSILKSEEIPQYYRRISEEESCEFLDASKIVTSSPLDSLHLGEHESFLFGQAVAKIVKQMLNEKDQVF
jgi:lysophospholipase L1-like esterase